MGWSEFEQKFGHLLSWEKAEEIANRKLDWHNSMDCAVYHAMLVSVVEGKMIAALTVNGN